MFDSNKRFQRQKRHARARAKIKGTESRPRFSVFRSANHIYAQLIDDMHSQTLLALADISIKESKKERGKKTVAFRLGLELAKKAAEAGIKKVVFDRSGYKFHGRILELAKGAREGGLIF